MEIFVELGRRISSGVPLSVVERATSENKWFSVSDIEFAVAAINSMMLDRERIESWVSDYETKSSRSESILIVMAGNIPLVSFFDLLCVLVSGHKAIIKLSHKDRVLIGWIVDILRDIESSIPIFIYNERITPDRVIATGGDAAVRHFGELYRGVTTLLRGSRHSVAVLSNGENELDGLKEDIYRYSGLGCRNVSMIFVHKGYDLSNLQAPKLEELNPKHRNNYLQNRALLNLRGESFIDNGASCLIYQDHFPTQISTLAIVEYDEVESVERWIKENDEVLQCVVASSSTINHPRRVDFGEAQRPTLYDYADGVDTMSFLK
ncbi:MAG: aldehyde dehydrogenase [Rikenellaceae bacterium]